MLKKIRTYINNKPKEFTDYIRDISNQEADFYQGKFEKSIVILINIYIISIISLYGIIENYINPNIWEGTSIITNKYFILINFIYQNIFFIGYWILYLPEPTLCNSKNISKETAQKIKKTKFKYMAFFCLFLFLSNLHKF